MSPTGRSHPGELSDSLIGVIAEVRTALQRVDPVQATALAEAVLQAKRVYVVGAGRSGLVSSCLAMRLVHLGLDAHVVGEVTAPGVARGDLLVVSSGSGRTLTVVAQTKAAKARGARVAAVTANADSPLAQLCDVVVVIPCAPFAPRGQRGQPERVQTAQFGGSLFEQSCLLFYDALVLDMARQLHISPRQMQIRHANLE